MQTSKFIFALGAAAVVILPLQVQAAPDNESQAQMREALRLKMQELNPGSASSTVTPPTEPASVVKVAPAPVPQPAPVVVVAPATQVVAVPPPAAVAPISTPEDAAEAERAREVVRQKITQLQSSPAAARSVGATPAGMAPMAATSYTHIEPPASPLSGTKQARLSELLARYKADSITALEYHTQRAAIMAEQ